jgi:hypothetical protein
MKKLNHKDKFKTDIYDRPEGNHYFKRLKTTRQQKAHEALDRALKQKDFKRLRVVDEYDFY